MGAAMTPILYPYDGGDVAADWQPVTVDDQPGDVDRAWTMAAHLCKMHRYHLAAYLGWSTAYGRGLCTEAELRDYLDCYELADALGISWRRVARTVWSNHHENE